MNSVKKWGELRQETGYDAIEKTRKSDKDATFF